MYVLIGCLETVHAKLILVSKQDFPYTDYQQVRNHRHFSQYRDNKMNARRKHGIPAKYHEVIKDSGYDNGAACPEFIKRLFRDEIINGRVSSIAMILTVMQVGGYTRENICHPNLWVTQIFIKHHRVLAGLETKDNHADFSGDGIPPDFLWFGQ